MAVSEVSIVSYFVLFKERALQAPSVSQAPPPPASISPTSDSGKHANRRSRKSERPLPTKTLPASSASGTETPLTSTASKADTENASTVDNDVAQRNDKDSEDPTSKPAISDASAKDELKDKIEKDERPLVASQQPPASDQKEVLPTSSTGVTGAVSANPVPSMGVISGVPPGTSPEGLPALLPGRVSLDVLICPNPFFWVTFLL